MKNLFVLLLLIIVISCKKEQEKTLLDYCGTYSIESTIIGYKPNLGGICYTDMDSLEAYQADSLAAFEPPYIEYTDVKTSIITIVASPNSKNKIVVLGIFDFLFKGKDSCTFYNPPNTSELYFLNCNDFWKNDSNYIKNMDFKDDEIYFNFKALHPSSPVSLTFSGTAKKIN